ncbi:hypothetical protein GQ42DRAFT_176035 [Ramicandelaber brevisporus]|nr:hypothetical protein GQ42DRAFT_176035 [Ramicandelaber brevisporus]
MAAISPKQTNLKQTATMRLLELPRDILLYLTDFFDDCEASPLLTVSSQFHDLFARAVWRIVDAKTLELNPVVRSAALARYGDLVRFVTVRKNGDAFLLYPLNWHLKLPHVVGFCFIINNKLSAEFKRRIFVGIRSLVNLRRLFAYIQETGATEHSETWCGQLSSYGYDSAVSGSVPYVGITSAKPCTINWTQCKNLRVSAEWPECVICECGAGQS